jgi:hypothetical protein
MVVLAAAVLAPCFPGEAKGENQAKKLVDKLASTVNLDKGIDKDTPFKDAMEFISEQYGVPIIVNFPAFKDEEILEIANAPVQLPKMNGVRISTLLRLLTAQVPQGAYIVRSTHVEIIPVAQLRREVWGDRQGPQLPLVHAVFEKRPLDEALQELSDLTGINIVVDGRAGDLAKTPVTGTLLNVPLDTAVRVLADMADLGVVMCDNVQYVTSKANAKALQAEQEKRMLREVHVRKEPKGAIEKPEAPKVPTKEPK